MSNGMRRFHKYIDGFLSIIAPVLTVPIVFIAMHVIDPFGIGSESKRQSRSIVDLIVAPFHDLSYQEAITVVLIDDQSLRDADRHWPLETRVLTRLLDDIASRSPSAVFVDLLMLSGRQGAGEVISDEKLSKDFKFSISDRYYPILDKGKRFYEEEVDGVPQSYDRIPILFASLNPGFIYDDEEEKCPKDTVWHAIHDVSSLSVVQWTEKVPSYPLKLGKNLGGCLQEYLDTPAFILYDHYCSSKANSEKLTGRCRQEEVDRVRQQAKTRNILVEWGAATPTSFSRFSSAKCRLWSDSTLMEKISTSIFSFWVSITHNDDQIQDVWNYCPFTPTVLADLTQKPMCQEESNLLNEMLKDKIVLVGADVRLVPDRVATPVNGTMPGVYYHAMALENLLRLGSEYRYDPAEDEDNPVDYMILFGILIMLNVGFIKFLSKENVKSEIGNRKYRINFQFLCLSLVVISIYIIACSILLPWPAADYLGMFGISLVVFEFTILGFISALIFFVKRRWARSTILYVSTIVLIHGFFALPTQDIYAEFVMISLAFSVVFCVVILSAISAALSLWRRLRGGAT